MHIVQPPRVWLEGSDGWIIPGGVSVMPGVGVQTRRFRGHVAIRLGSIPEAVKCRCSRPAAVLPFTFGREPNHFVRCEQARSSQFLRGFRAEFEGLDAGHGFGRVAGPFPAAGIRAHDSLVEILGDFVTGDRKGLKQRDFMKG